MRKTPEAHKLLRLAHALLAQIAESKTPEETERAWIDFEWTMELLIGRVAAL